MGVETCTTRAEFYPRKLKMFAAAAAVSHEVFFSCDSMKKDGVTASQRFASVRTHLCFVRFIQQGGVKCFYEMIRESRPCKMYFDVEWVTATPTESTGLTITTVEDAIAKVFSTLFPSAPPISECVRLKASRFVSSGFKHSFHLIYPGVVFSRNTGRLKQVAVRVAASLKSQTEISAVDTAVYTKDRAFRAPYCYKLTDHSKTPFLFEDGQDDGGGENMMKALVTHIPSQSEYPYYYIDDTAASAPPPPTPRARPKIQACPDSLNCSPREISMLVQCVEQFLRKRGGGGVVSVAPHASHTKGTVTLRYNHKNPGMSEPCLSHGPFSTVFHKSDNQFIHIDRYSFVVVVCPHGSKCSKRFFSFGRLMRNCVPIMDLVLGQTQR